MQGPELVAGIPAGDLDALAEAYDRYAEALYAYCRSILPDPADAADAVQDTYLIATVELGRLRDPARLRPWLYAVARNECRRRLRAGSLTATLDEAVDLPADVSIADPAARAERAELQALVRSAIQGLGPKDRDLVELSLVHELEGDDLVDTLGVPRNHAHALLSRARSRLEKSLGALIVARSGRQACPELDGMLAGWDGQLTVLMRKRINRHLEQCAACGECKRRELSPALLAGVAPLAAALPGLRDQVLRALTDRSPAGLAHKFLAARRAGPFARSGFPRAASGAGGPAARHPRALAAGTLTSVMAVGAIAIVGITGTNPAAPPGAGRVTHNAMADLPEPAALGAPGPGATSRASSSATTPPAPPAQDASGHPVAPTSAVSSPASSATPAQRQGTLIVTPPVLDLVVLHGTPIGTLTLTAVGGPVDHYSVSVASALAGGITVSPSSGSLAAGASVTITVTPTTLLTLNARITVTPGDHTITVLLAT